MQGSTVCLNCLKGLHEVRRFSTRQPLDASLGFNLPATSREPQVGLLQTNPFMKKVGAALALDLSPKPETS